MVRSDGHEGRVDTRWFQGLLADKKISQRRLAKTIGMDPAAVSLMFHGKRKMSAAEAAAIGKVLSVDVQEVITRAGIVVPPSTGRGAPAVREQAAVVMAGGGVPGESVTSGNDLLEIPVPLSDGSVARLQLPKVLTKADAAKIAAIVGAFSSD